MRPAPRTPPRPNGRPPRSVVAGVVGEAPRAEFDTGGHASDGSVSGGDGGGDDGGGDGGREAGDDGGDDGRAVGRRLLTSLDVAMTAVQARATDELTEDELVSELEGLTVIGRRLAARSARLTAAVTERQARRAREAQGGNERAADRARKRAERDLAQRLRQSAGEIARNAKRGQRGGTSSPGDAAFDRGDLPAVHASLLFDTLEQIHDVDRRLEAEHELLEAAASQNPKEFGRTCRLLLARVDQAAASRAEEQRHGRRQASTWQTPDGMTAFRGEWAAVDGEIITTALNAFRRHDAPGERRTPERRLADAAVEMASAALRAGEAPTQHGVRPHIMVTIDWQTILAGAGMAHLANGGPVPYDQVRRLLADCGVSRLLMDARSLPTEAGESVRTVPVGLLRELVLRDGSCIGHGCDMPPQFCEVMHLGVPYHLEGRLTLDSSGLGCKFHHYGVDILGWPVIWVDGRPVTHHPNHPPTVEEVRAARRTSASATATTTGQRLTQPASSAPSRRDSDVGSSFAPQGGGERPASNPPKPPRGRKPPTTDATVRRSKATGEPADRSGSATSGGPSPPTTSGEPSTPSPLDRVVHQVSFDDLTEPRGP